MLQSPVTIAFFLNVLVPKDYCQPAAMAINSPKFHFCDTSLASMASSAKGHMGFSSG